MGTFSYNNIAQAKIDNELHNKEVKKLVKLENNLIDKLVEIKRQINDITKNEEKPKKKLENILNLYRNKMQEYHGKMFNYNEDFKNFIRKYTQIKKELNDLERDIKNKKENINNLVKNQNEQIENNNFDMAETIEEEIKKENGKIEELTILLKQKNEINLPQIKLNLNELIK